MRNACERARGAAPHPADQAAAAKRFAMLDALIAAANAEKVLLAKSLTPGARPPRGALRLRAAGIEITPARKAVVDRAVRLVVDFPL